MTDEQRQDAGRPETGAVDQDHLTGDEIAIIGTAGRFPGSPDVESFWHHLLGGVEGIVELPDETLRSAGVPDEQIADPRYVKAAPLLAGHDRFDASFFGYSPLEAEVMDPQQRLLLECAWQALEDAGHDPACYEHPIGVFAGSKTNTYLFHLASKPEVLRSRDMLQLILGGDQALLATRISYKLDLKGPSYAVQTACSSALVSVHLACRSLLLDECRMALAGGVAVNVPHDVGYLYDEGGILSPDGHCRPFDADAAGTVFGSGLGMVVLKRLADAREDGDTVRAVILGSATNNDGSDKATFTAPSVDGQTEVVLEALADAGVEADSIGFVEAHGTGTRLGDPIEVLALTNAYRASTRRRGFCLLGSAKGNVGHLDAAAGMPGLIKAVRAVAEGEIPPTLHYERPNPAIDFDDSPFVVAGERRHWPRRDGRPRRAAVSSLGFGGTNAHLILEEPPVSGPGEAANRESQLLVLSARDETALDTAAERLAEHLETRPRTQLADVAWTLQMGRRGFARRRAVVAASRDEAVERLRGADPAMVVDGGRLEEPRPVFLFPGQGAQYPGMGRGLYDGEPVFRRGIDRAAELLKTRLDLDLRDVLFPGDGAPEIEAAAQRLRHTAVTQPALLAVEHALALLWRSWGVEPAAMLGHSVGEYTAAVLAGVMRFEDALALVAERGRLMGELPAGAMTAVRLPAERTEALLDDDVALAAVNAPDRCVVSGPEEAVARFEERARAAHGDGDDAAARKLVRRLHTSHAFHSAMMEPILDPFRAAVEQVELSPPEIPFLSNLSGDWIGEDEATDPDYWVRHLRGAVRFADGMGVLLAEPGAVLLEVGPGTTLTTFARRCDGFSGAAVAPSLRHPRDQRADVTVLLASLGRVWAVGLEPDWSAVHGGTRRRRVSLPAYPFDVTGRRHWIDLASAPAGAAADPAAATPQTAVDSFEPPASVTLEREPEIADWLYAPVWEPLEASGDAEPEEGERWLLFTDPGDDLAAALEERLRAAGARVVSAEAATDGGGYERLADDRFRLAPGSFEDHDRLLTNLAASGRLPARIVHLWNTGEWGGTRRDDGSREWGGTSREAREQRGFWSLLALAQGLARREARADLTVVTSGMVAVQDGDPLLPERALLHGPVKVLPKEHPEITCRAVDLASGETTETRLAALWSELTARSPEPLTAWRGGVRHGERFSRLEDAAPAPSPLLTDGGVYLVTGGLGGVGSVIAGHLAQSAGARLVLTGRSELPPRESWDELLAADGAQDDATATKLRRVRHLEELGAEVMTVAADVTDRRAMTAAVDAARERFGRIQGVVHAAGVAGGGLLQLKTEEQARTVLDPKVAGTRVLADVFDGGDGEAEPPDFLLLVSSLQTVMADFGQVDYAAANAFLDAFARRRHAAGRTTLAVDFDNWREVGILVDVGLPPHLEPWREELLGKALGNDEALEVLRRVLATPRPRVAVSTQDLTGRVELSRRLTRNEILRELGPGDAPATAAASLEGVSGSELTRRMQRVWRKVLDLGDFDPAENFFDLGGDSLTGMQLIAELNRELGLQLQPVDLYDAPSVSALVERLAPARRDDGRTGGDAGPAVTAEPAADTTGAADERQAVAVIGLAGRFPGAADVDELWDNLCAGREAVRFFSDDELRAAGVADDLLADPDYVKARPVLADVDRFDAAFFGYSPRDARILDPQHRLFMEHSWQALEDAGYDPQRFDRPVGVFGGSSISSYLRLLWADPELSGSVGEFQALIGNEKDSLTTHTSYKLDLRGPSVAVQTFCSTSLVAVHSACRSLLDGECDMALAGGVSIHLPQTSGYRYDPSGGVSKDGHLRAFDADASGYVFGNGVGVVVLKRLSDAVADGDTIRAVVLGSAVNNDGSLKVGYTATAVDGQAAVISRALDGAGVDPASVGYVECHGSGTPLGDPVEIAALNRAFGRGGGGAKLPPGTLPVGSVKTNVGHLDRASGVTGLIKAILALERGAIPPSLHFREPNPNIDFAGGPFYVNTEHTPWPRPEDGRRRAAVNSLGLGGTNCHVVLEEAPPVAASSNGRAVQLLTVSARTESALEAACADLAEAVEGRSDRELADAAWTLQVGRRPFEHRRAVVVRDADEASRALTEGLRGRVHDAVCRDAVEPPVVFLFSGLSSQYAGMGAGLYLAEEVFREELDRCAGLLEPHAGVDVREVLWPDGAPAAADARTADGGGLDLKSMLGRGGGGEERDEASRRLDRTAHAQPALFALEVALARQWRAWGIEPAAMLGYSLGEYVAAVVAGVLSLADAAELVARRARLIDGLPGGAMLGVPLTPEELAPRLEADDALSLAAVNGPQQSVAAGPDDAVDALAERLQAEGVSCRRLSTTHAFHSAMMEAIREPVTELAAGFEHRTPRIPYLSNVTGTWIADHEASDPAYWGEHACRPVRFAPAVAELARDPERVLLEVGPGQTLTSLALQCAGEGEALRTVASLPGNFERAADDAHAATALGKLWLFGCRPDWRRVHSGERRRRVPLPTYPFERRRFWVEPAAGAAPEQRAAAPPVAGDVATPGGRLHVPTWKRTPLPPSPAPSPAPSADEPATWLLLAADGEPGDALADRLAAHGHRVTRLAPGDDPAVCLQGLEEAPAGVVHAWPLAATDDAGRLERGYLALRRLAAALAAAGAGDVDLWVLTRGVYDVTGGETLTPLAATVLAPCQTLPLEHPGITPRVLELDDAALEDAAALADRLVAEIAAAGDEQVVAYRGRRRWTTLLEPLPVGERSAGAPPEGAWIVWTGERTLHADGLRLARQLARAGRRHVLLVTPDGAPPADGVGAEALDELRALGAEVACVAAGPAATVVSAARERFGAVAGVLMAPAPPDERDGDLGAAGLAALAARLDELDAALDGETPEARLLLSSLAAPDAGDLTAAFARNLLFDAHAHAAATAADATAVTPWVSVSWDLWDDGADDRALAAFRALLAAPPGPQVLVSSRPLARGWNRVSGAAGGDATTPPGERHPRPQLKVEYLAPRNEVERTIAAVWEELLGIEQVGVHDNFLELGGDSLLASRLATRLRSSFDLDLPVRLFFEASTVEALAEVISDARAEQEKHEIDDLYARLASMSDEEVMAELEKREHQTAVTHGEER